MKELSRFISRLSHPVLTFPLALVLLFEHWGAWNFLVPVFFLSFGAPLTYFLWLLRKGKISDFDISKREQRHPVYAAALIGMGLSLFYLSFALGAQDLFQEYLLLMLLGVLLVLVNFKVKVSIHVAMSMLLISLLIRNYELSVWLFAAVLPVALSRVRLKRHSYLEVVLGVAIPVGFWLTYTLLGF